MNPSASTDPSGERHGTALVDRSEEVGSSSTRPSPTSWTGEAGVDTLRLLFETGLYGDRVFEIEDVPGWRFGSTPALGQTFAEGHPAVGKLASVDEILAATAHVRDQLDDRLGILKDLGVSRSDQTVNTSFGRDSDAKAFLAGMASVDLPRTETTRRGHPVHSIAWTHPAGRRKLARCYDKGLEQGGEAFETVRLEDQRRYVSGDRPPIEVVADTDYLQGRFKARFGPIRKAVDGVKAATFPVVAQALADEARYGYRSVREVERLAGALVILSGGGSEAYKRSTYYNRRAELREAGYVVVDDLVEAVEVNLGDVVEDALDRGHWS
jgi:hypothetical protein